MPEFLKSSLFWLIFFVLFVSICLPELLAQLLVIWKRRRDRLKSMGTPVADMDLDPEGVIEADGRKLFARVVSGSAKKGDLLRIVGKKNGQWLVEKLENEDDSAGESKSHPRSGDR